MDFFRYLNLLRYFVQNEYVSFWLEGNGGCLRPLSAALYCKDAPAGDIIAHPDIAVMLEDYLVDYGKTDKDK